MTTYVGSESNRDRRNFNTTFGVAKNSSFTGYMSVTANNGNNTLIGIRSFFAPDQKHHNLQFIYATPLPL